MAESDLKNSAGSQAAPLTAKTQTPAASTKNRKGWPTRRWPVAEAMDGRERPLNASTVFLLALDELAAQSTRPFFVFSGCDR